MKHSLTKKLLTVAAIFASVSLFSAEEQPQEKVMDQGHGINEHQMMGAYSAPARFDVKGSWDVFMTASFIYWQAKQGGLDLAYVQFAPVDGAAVHPNYIADMEFDYEPGFKVGLGFNFLHDNWFIFAEYTRIHGDSDRRLSLPENASIITPSFHQADATYVSAKSTYDSRVDLIDFYMGRPYYSGTKLTVEPHFGLRGGWLKQHVNFYNVHTLTLEEAFYMHSSSWVIGPRAGLNGFWHLGEGFRICGNINAALLYQHMDASILHSNDITADPVVYNHHYHHNNSAIIPNVDMGIGLAWGMYLGDHDFHLDLSALYDFNYFWNQGAIRTLYDEVNNSAITNPGDFWLHGLTINARLDF